MGMKKIGTVIIGGGPAGLSVLLAARQGGLLKRFLSAGLKIIEKTETIGAGEIRRYSIRSDRFADSFLASPTVQATPALCELLTRSSGMKLEKNRGRPVELTLVADYLADIGATFERWSTENGSDIFVKGAKALQAKKQDDQTWITTYQTSSGDRLKLQSRAIILATGAEQTAEPLYSIRVAGKPLLPRYISKTVLSKDILSHNGNDLLNKHLSGKHSPKVAIIGGSHSSISSALVCLRGANAFSFDRQAITLLHRRDLCLTYTTPEAALADGFTAFQPEDICPRTGRVFPLAGFRSDSRDLIRKALQLGEAEAEPRLRLVKLQEETFEEANNILEEADLIIAALGYRPRALPLLDCSGQPMQLFSHTSQDAPLVDECSHVLDGAGRPIDGVFALGLSAGYPLAGRYGEPSFKGQANGLSLWQSDIGEEIVNQILELEGAHQ